MLGAKFAGGTAVGAEGHLPVLGKFMEFQWPERLVLRGDHGSCRKQSMSEIACDDELAKARGGIDRGQSACNFIGIDETGSFEIRGQDLRGKGRLSHPVRACDEDQGGHGGDGSNVDFAFEHEICGAS